MNRLAAPQEKNLTLADICEAIAAGKLQAKIENGSYHIRRNELRSLARRIDANQATRAERPAELAS